jgi:hypothetical protein
MAHRIRREMAVADQVFECFVTRDGLVLTKRLQQIHERLSRNIELAHCPRQRHEHGMAREAVIAGIEFGLPFVKQLQRGCGIAYFVTQIVGDAAVGVDIEEVLP